MNSSIYNNEKQIRALGFRSRLIGYKYLVSATDYYCQYPQSMTNIYNNISADYSVSSASIEIAIRRVLEDGFGSPDSDILYNFFGSENIDKEKGKLTNLKFLVVYSHTLNRYLQ